MVGRGRWSPAKDRDQRPGPGSTGGLGDQGVELTDVPEGDARRNLPSVEGPSPERAAPDGARSGRSKWSMWVAPARMDATRVSTLRPGRAPPIRPPSRTVVFARASRPRRTPQGAYTSRPVQINTSPRVQDCPSRATEQSASFIGFVSGLSTRCALTEDTVRVWSGTVGARRCYERRRTEKGHRSPECLLSQTVGEGGTAT